MSFNLFYDYIQQPSPSLLISDEDDDTSDDDMTNDKYNNTIDSNNASDINDMSNE